MTKAVRHAPLERPLEGRRIRPTASSADRVTCINRWRPFREGCWGKDVVVPRNEVDSNEEPKLAWDPSLYAGSAAHYAAGRVSYPAEVVEVLVSALQLDGSGRLLDVGCGPGSLTLLLAPHFEQAIGVDADADMLSEAARQAEEKQVTNVVWRQLRGEDLPADLPPARLVTFAQSFHWMDRPQVASAARGLLAPGGALAHVHGSSSAQPTRSPHRFTRCPVRRRTCSANGSMSSTKNSDACSPRAAPKGFSVSRWAPSRSTSGADACW